MYKGTEIDKKKMPTPKKPQENAYHSTNTTINISTKSLPPTFRFSRLMGENKNSIYCNVYINHAQHTTRACVYVFEI